MVKKLRPGNVKFTTRTFSVEAGTNGYQGGDSGHGSRTYFRISDEGGTDLSARVMTDCFGDTHGVEIALGGDAELSTMVEALKFATRVLEDQIKEAEI